MLEKLKHKETLKMLNSTTQNFGVITLKQLAKSLGKPESTVRTWKRRGEIPAECFSVIGSTVFVKVEVMQDWLMKGGLNDSKI